MTTIDDVTTTALSYGQTKYAQGMADQALASAAALASAQDALTTLQAKYDAYVATHPDVTPPPPPPPPSTVQRFGVYVGGNAAPTSVTGNWKKQPNLFSAYIGWNASIPNSLTTAAKQGQTIQVELDTGTAITWADVAAGGGDAKLTSKFEVLNNLGVPVWVSLCNEADLKASNGQVTAGQTGAQYAAAANHFADLIAKGGYKNLEPMVWFAGSGPVGSFLPSAAKFTHIGWDPYKTGTHPTTDTATDTFKPFITRYLSGNDGWQTKRRHINETGVVTNKGFSNTVCAAYYTSIKAAMDALDIESVTVFWDNSGGKTYTSNDPIILAGLNAGAQAVLA